jgi:hypothetical protein
MKPFCRFGWVLLGLAIVLAIVGAPRFAAADSSCTLYGYTCGATCASCYPVYAACDYSTGCQFGSASNCSPGDQTLDDLSCFITGGHDCQHSGYVQGYQCSSCPTNYFGYYCDPCPGVNCNNNGSCDDGIVGSGTCNCYLGYAGYACQYSRWTTCSGHGQPYYNGSCGCDTGWAGPNCGYCDTNYYPNGGTCTYCLASSTCNGNGSCNAYGQCQCNVGYSGPYCQSCDANYYGYPACKYCVSSYTCESNGTCDGNGNCACQVGSGPNCETCSALGCGAYLCGSSGVCPTSCTSDAQCASGNFCEGAQCSPKLANGVACGSTDQCTSGNCVDGVCCNSDCTSQCATCAAPGSLGVCSPATGAPQGGRPACQGDGSACNGRCDGNVITQCQFPDPATSCRASSCSAGVATEGAHCNGSGTCGPLVQDACGSYACGTTACLTACATIDDCALSAFCTGQQCEPDSVPPSVTFVLPAYTNQPLSLAAQVVDNGAIASVALLVNGAPVAGSFDASTGSFVMSPLPLSEGANVVLVQATDRAGNTGGAQVTVIRDTVPPAVGFLAPAANQAVGNPSVNATVSVTDATPTVVTLGPLAVSLPAGGGVASATVPLPGQGLQAITVTAQDGAGNVGTASIQVLVDLSGPAVDVDVANGSIFGPEPGNLLPLTVDVNDVAATTVAIGSQTYDIARGGGVVQSTVPLVEGANAFTVIVRDETGKSTTLSEAVTYDTTPPVAAITVPAENAFVRGTVELSVEASDAISGVSSVSFQVDSAPSAPATGGSGQPWVLSFDTTTLADGPHVIGATATDGVGNVRTLRADVTVDNTNPVVQLTQPTAGAFVRSVIQIVASATDAGGVASVSLTANGAPIGSCSTASCTISYDTSTNPDGTLLLAATAIDRAGNHSAPSSVAVISVNQIPGSFIVSPAAGSTVADNVVVAVNVVDAYFENVACSVDGVSLGSSTNPNFTQTVSTAGKLDGPIVVRCTLTDLAGNTSTRSVTATIKNWRETLVPETLNLKAGGKTVTLSVDGPTVSLLLPLDQHALALVVPGGSPAALVSGSSGRDGNEVTLLFDRSQLEASIAAGIASHAIDPDAEVGVHLFAGTRDLGVATIRVVH